MRDLPGHGEDHHQSRWQARGTGLRALQRNRDGRMSNASRELLGRDRTPFLPDVVWRSVAGNFVRLDRHEDPDAWHAAADADCPLVTQWDDGASEDPEGLPTCSASMPSLVRAMLDECDILPGHRVLEVGTGTGYTAALLKDRVGSAGVVVSVEVDAGIASAARERLAAAGVEVDAVCADGLAGWKQGAPFDRVHITCGIRAIPSAWLRQCPDGKLVMPWGPANDDGAERLLSIDMAGGIGIGRLGEKLSFMKARSQRSTPWYDWPDTGEAGKAELPVTWSEIEGPTSRDDEFALGLLSGTTFRLSGSHDDEDGRVLWLERGGEYASIGFGKHHATTIAGDSTVIGAYCRGLRWWLDHGRPRTARPGTTRHAERRPRPPRSVGRLC
ncbi:methyltransferase domain-containing protein [Embleya sp. AB8]|uniref:methyltransferase domain-containing protein n=1 Tax=Embleya sp. AB8 TaxID=3156304 RepID=UPI003C7136A8